MTEPVAYLQLDIHGKEMVNIEKDMNGYETKPLYTEEQLQPRVQMTQAEFDEFKKLLSVGIGTIYEAFDVINSDRGEMDEFEQLYNRLFANGVNEQAKQQIEFVKLWDSLSTCLPEETISIVSEKEWFIETKNVTSDYRFVKIEFENKSVYNKSLKMYATHFKTKSQAEEWKNPLTKVVLLPIEGE